MSRVPFTYHICWTKDNLHYYGVRYAIGCHPNDLWTKYHTSSPKVKYLRESLGEPDIIEVRKIFDTTEKARDWELRVLKHLGVTKRDDWINMCIFPAYDRTGIKTSLQTKEKLSSAAKGKKLGPRSEETKRKISRTKTGVKTSIEVRKKLSVAKIGNLNALGMKHTIESKKKMSDANKGRVFTLEHRQKLSESRKEYWRKRKILEQGNL